MTYARLTTLQADPGKIDDGIRFFREFAVTDARKLQGFQGARLLVDRQSGKVQAVTLWESESAAQASAEAVSQSRGQLISSLGATNPTVELFELAVNESA
jgi:heme-degrading monooxygenase HmoA